MSAPIAAIRSRSTVSASSRSTAPVSSPSAKAYVAQPDAEAQLVHALGVVVLVPEQRQQHHRLAEVHRLGRGVVAAVGDHQVDLRASAWSAGRVAAPVMLSASRSSSARGPMLTMTRCRVVPRTSISRCISADVGAAERAEREVDQPAVVGPVVRALRRDDVVLVGLADAGVDPVPGVVERPGVGVVELARVDVEVGDAARCA